MKSSKYFYNLESKANKDGSRLVFFNLSYGYSVNNPLTGERTYKPMKISTKIRVKKEEWDFTRNELDGKYANNAGKTKKHILDRIVNFSRMALDGYYDNHSTIPEPSELKRLIQVRLGWTKKQTQSVSLESAIDSIIADDKKLSATAKGKVGAGQIAKYLTIKGQLLEFEKVLGRELTLLNFDKDLFFKFLDYTNEKRKENPKYPNGYLVNAIGKNANTLTALLRKAKKKGLDVALDLDDERLRINEVAAVDADAFLTEEVLQQIINTDPISSKEFINAKNYLIICSLTSLRYEDMEHLHEIDIENFNGKKHQFQGFISELRKTSTIGRKVEVCLPLMKPVKAIIIENNGKFPRFPVNQVMNKQLKKFAKYAGLDKEYRLRKWYYKLDEPVIETVPLFELVKCHIGRSSFVSNLSKMNVSHAAIENITHPTTPKGILETVYNKSSLVDRAELFIDSLRGAHPSVIYCI
jgi:hypothetical protein